MYKNQNGDLCHSKVIANQTWCVTYSSPCIYSVILSIRDISNSTIDFEFCVIPSSVFLCSQGYTVVGLAIRRSLLITDCPRAFTSEHVSRYRLEDTNIDNTAISGRNKVTGSFK